MAYRYEDFILSDYEIEKIKISKLQTAINNELKISSSVTSTVLTAYTATQSDIETRRKSWYSYYITHNKVPQNVVKPAQHIPKIKWTTFSFIWPDNIFGNFSNPGLNTTEGRNTVNSIYEGIRNWQLLDENAHLTITSQSGHNIVIESLAETLELENGDYHVSGWVGRPYDDYYKDNNNGTVVHNKALCRVDNDFTINDRYKRITLEMHLCDYIITSNSTFIAGWFYDTTENPTWITKDFYFYEGIKYQFISSGCNVREHQNITYKESRSFHCSHKLLFYFSPSSFYFNTIQEGGSCYLTFNLNNVIDFDQTNSGTTNENNTEQETNNTISGTTDQTSTEEQTSGTSTYQNNAIIISLEEIPTEMSSNNEHGEIVKSEFSNLILTSLSDISIVNIVLQNTENGSRITITDLTQPIAVPNGTYNVSGYIGRGNNEDARTAYSTCKLVTNCQITVNDSEKPQIPFTLEDAVVVSERPFTCEEKYDLNNTTIIGHYYNQTQNVEPHQCGDYYYMFLTNNSHSGVSYITVTNRIYYFNVNSTVYSYMDSGTKMGKFYYYNPLQV